MEDPCQEAVSHCDYGIQNNESNWSRQVRRGRQLRVSRRSATGEPYRNGHSYSVSILR